MYISDIQRSTMQKVEFLIENMPGSKAREWFTQYELPGTTLNTMNALVNKGFLESKTLSLNGVIYYRFVKRIDGGTQ